MIRFLICLVILSLTAGCAVKRPVAERQFFLLQAERGGAPRAPIPGTLRIGRVGIVPPFGDRGFVYRRNDVRYETDFYNQFAADPADMVAEGAANWLKDSGTFARVLPHGAADPADYRLDANVAALYVDFQGEAPEAVLRVRWYGVREKDGTPFLGLDTEERVPLAERSPAGTARAYREALRRVLGKLEAAIAGARF